MIRRRLRAVALAVSLLLCVASVVLWVRSYRRQDLVRIDYRVTRVAMNSARGRVGVLVFRRGDDSGGSDRGLAWGYTSSRRPAATMDFVELDQPGAWEFWGFGYIWDVQFFDGKMYALMVPWWFVALMLLLPWAGSSIVAWRKRNRRRRSLCAVCGYDLRASTSRCPECGMAVPKKAETQA